MVVVMGNAACLWQCDLVLVFGNITARLIAFVLAHVLVSPVKRVVQAFQGLDLALKVTFHQTHMEN